MSKAYVGIGSNMGDKLSNLQALVSELEGSDGVKVLCVSSAYVSDAVGVTDQPDFLNGVVVVETGLTPRGLLELLQEIELKYGRKRYRHWGPRTLDADILLYGQREIDEPDLKVPHPRLTERRFVLEPLLEVAPGLALPDGTLLKSFLESVRDKQNVRRVGEIMPAAEGKK